MTTNPTDAARIPNEPGRRGGPLVSRDFPLRYPTICAACEEPMREGDPAHYDAGELVHSTCPTVLAVDYGTCPVCWTRKTVTGACLCEED